MKFISFNVNGIRASKTHGFDEAFKSLDADFFSIQETKMQEGQIDLEIDGSYRYMSSAEKIISTEYLYHLDLCPEESDSRRPLDKGRNIHSQKTTF